MLKLRTGYKSLGDLLSILVGLHNYATHNNRSIGITSRWHPQVFHLFQQFLTVFDCPLLTVLDQMENCIDIDEHYHWATRTCEAWPLMLYRQLVLERGGRYLPNPLFPACKLNRVPDNVVCAQFDSRSAGKFPHKKPMAVQEMKAVLRQHAKNEKVVLIGGLDTLEYIPNAEYRRGDFVYLTQQLRNCQKFVGCDSGISHLAGMLQVPSIVIPLADEHCVRGFYKAYTCTEVHARTTFTFGKFL